MKVYYRVQRFGSAVAIFSGRASTTIPFGSTIGKYSQEADFNGRESAVGAGI
jgi:hypothetical protein